MMTSAAEAALAYYRDEANTPPLGGLKLAKFRNARDELARRGLIVQTPTGRWVVA